MVSEHDKIVRIKYKDLSEIEISIKNSKKVIKYNQSQEIQQRNFNLVNKYISKNIFINHKNIEIKKLSYEQKEKLLLKKLTKIEGFESNDWIEKYYGK